MMKLVMAAICTFGCASGAMAQDVIGTTAGVFNNPVPASSTTTGTGTSVFTYGDGAPPNRLTFVGTPFASTFETPFRVGNLSYFNGTTTAGTSPTSVDLALTLVFATPSIPATTSAFSLTLVATPNTTDPDASADYVYFPSSFSTTQFDIGGTTYNVALTGFGNIIGDGFLASDSTQLHVREGGTASADLFAKVTVQTASVPEVVTWAMMILGFGALGVVMRRHRAVTTRVSYAA